MIIDYSVSIGNILAMLTMLGSVMFFVYIMKNDISLMQRDVTYLEEGQNRLTEAFSQLGKILTQVAVQDNRINMMEKKLDELSHGKGLVR